MSHLLESPRLSLPRAPVTIHDVARAAGLSTTTVSTALSGKGRLSDATRELVRDHAQKLGYDANPHAQSLRRGRSDIIGFFSPDLDLGVATIRTQTVGRLLYERGYTAEILAYTDRKGGAFMEQERLMSQLRRQKVRAMICNTGNLQSARAQAELQAYLEEGGLAVCFDWPLELEADTVVFDREHNTHLATRYVLERGHREIGLCVPLSLHSRTPRIAGFERALGEFGLEARPDWIVSVPFHLEAEREGESLARWFFDLAVRPTAMCIVSDTVAATFAALLNRAGVRVPDDLSIVGHDNRAIAELGALPLTTVSNPVEEISLAVVEMLDSRLSGRFDGPPRHQTVRGQLFERQSVRAL